MIDDIDELMQRKADIDARIAEIRAGERLEAIRQARDLISRHELTEADLFAQLRAKPRVKPSPKYRDPVSGALWSGRGRPPAWLGANREEYAIS
jgi:DNA-binding protein H-NS